MPTQKEIKKIARKQGITPTEASQRVFGRMRKLGWRPGGKSTKAWKKRQK